VEESEGAAVGKVWACDESIENASKSKRQAGLFCSTTTPANEALKMN